MQLLDNRSGLFTVFFPYLHRPRKHFRLSQTAVEPCQNTGLPLLTFLARCLKSSVLLMRPDLQSGFRYGFRHCTMNWDIWLTHNRNIRISDGPSVAVMTRMLARKLRLGLTSLRNVSLLFLANSLEVSASAVFVENWDNHSQRGWWNNKTGVYHISLHNYNYIYILLEYIYSV